MRRAMKAKKSVIAKGKMAKSVVFRGTKAKTIGGLKKTDLIRNKSGKIVSRKQSANGKKVSAPGCVPGWKRSLGLWSGARRRTRSSGFCKPVLVPGMTWHGATRGVSGAAAPWQGSPSQQQQQRQQSQGRRRQRRLQREQPVMMVMLPRTIKVIK